MKSHCKIRPRKKKKMCLANGGGVFKRKNHENGKFADYKTIGAISDESPNHWTNYHFKIVTDFDLDLDQFL